MCCKCSKLTGPPYINPRFKPWFRPRTRFVLVEPNSALPQIKNASTPHESTIASSFITVDLGEDIPVIIERVHSMAEKDIAKVFEDEPVISPDNISFFTMQGGIVRNSAAVVRYVDGNTALHDEELEQLESGTRLECEEMSKQTTAGDESLDLDKTSIRGSEPDSGIGTGSNIGSGSDMGTVSPSASEDNNSLIPRPSTIPKVKGLETRLILIICSF